MLPGAALGSLAARFCWQGQHFRLWTVPERVSGPPQAQHLAASRLVSAGRGSTSGSGRYPSAFRGLFLMLPGAALGSLAAVCWQGQARARFGAFALMLPGAALGSLAARFCWQGQRFRLWTVPERVSGPPPLDAARRSTREPRGSFLLAGAQHSGLVSAGRGSTSGSGRYPSAFRAPGYRPEPEVCVSESTWVCLVCV